MSTALAEQLRRAADTLERNARGKLSPAIASQRPTRRRMNIAAGMAADGLRMLARARAYRAIADAHHSGHWPPVLGRLSARSLRMLADEITRDGFDAAAPPSAAALSACGCSMARYRAVVGALRAIIARPHDARDAQAAEHARERQQRKDALRIARVPSFFPTPPFVVQEMVRLADLGPDVRRILEPCAGIGSILIPLARAAAEHAHADVVVNAREINHDVYRVLVDELSAAAAEAPLPAIGLSQGLCEDIDPSAQYDLIVTNPPFERDYDAMHALRMYQNLAPGGRLVGIGSAMLVPRIMARYPDWHAGVWAQHAHVAPLPEDTFDRPESFVRTGVRTVLYVLDKPL